MSSWYDSISMTNFSSSESPLIRSNPLATTAEGFRFAVYRHGHVRPNQSWLRRPVESTAKYGPLKWPAECSVQDRLQYIQS
ncbi:hypothetical protein D3C87_815930 [compost metagenome]|nr:hypothetical protein BSF40_18190 [Pseudomonas sp. ACN5]VVQ23516.1 hypothetical protein PS934_05515 [Pseudomonas fluorescens]